MDKISTFHYITSMPRMLVCVFGQFLGKTAPFVPNSLNGKLAIITGGNGGIGFETAKSLALQGCEVIILCRNLQSAEAKADEINRECKAKTSIGSCRFLKLDTSDLTSVKACIDHLRGLLDGEKPAKIDYFLCNAGIMNQPYSRSKQGYELHYATNHVGHFALVGGLFDLLRRSSARIIVLTGDIAIMTNDASPDFTYDDDGMHAYCRSKICNQAFAKLLQERYGNEISAYVVHPGVIDSNLVPATTSAWESWLKARLLLTNQGGAQSSLLCCVTDEVPPGSYYHNVLGVTGYNPTAADQAWAETMWQETLAVIAKQNQQQEGKEGQQPLGLELKF